MEDESEGRVKWSLKSTILLVLLVDLVATMGLNIGLLISFIDIVTGKHDSRSGIVGDGNVGVYTTQQYTTPLKRLDWRTMQPGSNHTLIDYTINSSDAPLRLSMQIINWNPATAAATMRVTWNYGLVIRPNQVIGVTWTLTVSEGATNIQDFSFNLASGNT